MKFPEDFIEKPHPIVVGATQWLYRLPEENKGVISIVGGVRGLYGDGINTFEMWHPSDDEPKSRLTKDEINNYLELKS